MKNRIRNFLVVVFAPFAYVLSERVKVRVLALHDIEESDREEFRRKMFWLKQNFNVVSLQDAYDQKNLSQTKTNVAITFDDGFKCFLNVIGEVLRELQIPATFFICSGVLDIISSEADSFTVNNLKRNSKKFTFLTSEELRKISETPLFEIGGHTRNHVDLGKVWEKEILEKEIKQDKEKLESTIGKKINFFAFPFGSRTNMSVQAVEVVKSSGYVSAFSILPEFWTDKSDNWRVGRDSLTLAETDLVWRAWLAGGYDWFTKLK
jgi:peptidoglycan/xylan/chitin deacetylase (PgdA/CDA1 family)